MLRTVVMMGSMMPAVAQLHKSATRDPRRVLRTLNFPLAHEAVTPTSGEEARVAGEGAGGVGETTPRLRHGGDFHNRSNSSCNGGVENADEGSETGNILAELHHGSRRLQSGRVSPPCRLAPSSYPLFVPT